MPVESASLIVEVIRRCHLLEPGQFEELCRSLLPRLAESRSLAREMIQRDWLTPYQANQLLQGKGPDLLLGSYVLLERLGEGGMGKVFKARNWKLGQVVALKLVHEKRLDSPQASKRFHREIRVAAQLDHPNIVRALDADAVGDCYFLVMEYVPGIDLRRLVRERGPLPVAQACDCICQAAQGLQYASSHGLVHRDIKPANLLLTPSGVIKVLDVGLARRDFVPEGGEHSSVGLTRDGVVLGTVDYMAPEQAANFHTADSRADLYSLGCTFYYLLTGSVPFPGGEPIDRLLCHRFNEPTPIEDLRPEVPAEVGAIVRKLMAKSPEERYQTPAELVADLNALKQAEAAARAGDAPTEPLVVLPSSPPRRKIKGPPAWALWTASAVLMGLLLLILVRVSFRSSPSSDLTPPRSADAETRPALADQLARLPMAAGEWDEAVAGLGGSPPPELRRVLGESLPRHWGPVQRLAFSPDCKWTLSSGAEGEIKVWDAGTGRVLHRLHGHQGDIVLLGFTADGNSAISAGRDSEVIFWDTTSWKQSRTLTAMPRNLSRVALSPDSRLLTVGLGNGKVQLWDLSGRSERRTISPHERGITALTFSADGRLLASAGQDNDIVVWDLSAGKEKLVLERLIKPVTFLAFHPQGRLLAAGVGGMEGLVRIWNVDTGVEVVNYLTGPNPQHGEISPDGRLLAVGNNFGETRLWQLTSGARLGSWSSGAVAFSPDSKTIACGTNHTVEFRDATGKARERSPEYASAIQCVAAHAGKQLLAWGARDGTIRLLGPTEREPRSTKSPHNRVEQLLFSPDGRQLASWGGDHRVRVWNTESGQLAAEPTYQAVRWFAFQGERRALLVWTQQGGLRRWDLLAGRDLGEVRAPLGDARSLSLSPDGGTLALGGGDGSIILRDPVSGQEKKTLGRDSADRPVNALLFSPDGKALLSSSLSGSGSKRWDLVKNKAQQLSENALYSCAGFSPSGALLAIGHADGAIRVWDPAAGERRATLRVGPSGGRIVQVAFLDERNLVSVNSNGTLYLLRLPGRDK